MRRFGRLLCRSRLTPHIVAMRRMRRDCGVSLPASRSRRLLQVLLLPGSRSCTRTASTRTCGVPSTRFGENWLSRQCSTGMLGPQPPPVGVRALLALVVCTQCSATEARAWATIRFADHVPTLRLAPTRKCTGWYPCASQAPCSAYFESRV